MPTWVPGSSAKTLGEKTAPQNEACHIYHQTISFFLRDSSRKLTKDDVNTWLKMSLNAAGRARDRLQENMICTTCFIQDQEENSVQGLHADKKSKSHRRSEVHVAGWIQSMQASGTRGTVSANSKESVVSQSLDCALTGVCAEAFWTA